MKQRSTTIFHTDFYLCKTKTKTGLCQNTDNPYNFSIYIIKVIIKDVFVVGTVWSVSLFAVM